MGLEIFSDPAYLAETLTAVRLPQGLDLARLEKDEGVAFSDGQDRLAGRIFRIGHLGAVQVRDVADGLDALERHLRRLRA